MNIIYHLFILLVQVIAEHIRKVQLRQYRPYADINQTRSNTVQVLVKNSSNSEVTTPAILYRYK